MAEELPNSISDLATNFSGIRVAHRTNLQQMEQLFNALSKKSAEYRDLWEKESAKNTASKTAIIALFEEGTISLTFFLLRVFPPIMEIIDFCAFYPYS